MTVVEVPPQELPTPPPQPTVNVAIQQTAAATPFLRAGEQWIGKYRCAQGETDLALHIERIYGTNVDAVFEFSHAPSGAGGSYHLRGRIDDNGRLAFSPGAWIDQPPGYVTVGMHGVVRGDDYSGRIDNGSCGDFHVSRR